MCDSLRWRRRRSREGQDGARMDDTRQGTLSLFAAPDASIILRVHTLTNRIDKVYNLTAS